MSEWSEGKLSVGGLSFDTNEESLAGAFAKYGPIAKVDIIRDKESGRSRGFGFVTFDNPEHAEEAMRGMNGSSLDGREILVDNASKGGGVSRGGGGSWSEGKLSVGGLSFDTNEESLAGAFAKYGPIAKVDIIRDKESGRSRGFGFVTFDNPEHAEEAMRGMNGSSLDGREILVDNASKGGGVSRGGGGSYGGGRGSYGGERGSYGGERGSYGGNRW